MKSPDFVLFNEIAVYLEEHQQSLRIKKLVFCACKNYWENDPNVLNTFLFKHLIIELWELNPNLERLKISINRLVNTLNRKDVYSVIGQIIINQLEKLYQNPYAPTKIAKVQAKSLNQVSPESKLDEVVKNLEEGKNASRIKKLIFAVTKKQWPTNNETLAQLPLQGLVEELRLIYPSLEEIEKSLYKIVNNLSKQDLYSYLTKVIISELGNIYDNKKSLKSSSNSVAYDEEKKSTQIKSNPKLNQPTVILPNFLEQYELNVNDSSFTSTPTSIINDKNSNLTQIQTFSSKEVSLSPQEQEQEQIKLTAKVPQESKPKEKAQPQSQLESQTQLQLNYNQFDLRVKIMEFSNPLAAKILVFSIVYHRFEMDIQDWSMLKTCNLDQLLESLFQQYPTITELEKKLYDTAESLEDSDRYLEPAGAIFKSIKPFYKQR